MKDVIIKIYKDSSVYTENGTLGINYENIQGKLVFEFVDEFVDGTAYLEFERKFEKGLIPMNKVGKTYEIEIKSSLLKEIGNIELQLRITQDEVPNGIPVYKSKVFALEVLDAINATSEIPDEYPEWIDLANEKIKEMDNLNITTERVEDGVDIVLTDKKGNTTRTEVKDGAPGPVGPQGEPGAVKMQVVDTLPETGRTDTIYLVKKDNPGEQNLYDEYVYTETGWEHIGDTSVDLSDYYTKEESNEKLLAKQDKLVAGENIIISEDNVISSSIGLPVLENQEININTFPVGAYIITGTDTVIKYGTNGLSSYKPITTNSSTGNTDSWILNITHGSGDESNRGFAFLFRRSGSSGGTAFYTFDFSGMNHVDISQLMTRNVNQSIYGRFDFYHALPTSSLVPSGDTELTNKKYVDDAVANINIPMYTITTTKSFMDGYINFETDVINKMTEIVNKNLDTGFELYIVDMFGRTFRFDIQMGTPSDTSNSSTRVIGYGLGSGLYTRVRKFIVQYSTKDGLYTFSQFISDGTQIVTFENEVLTKDNTDVYTPTGNYNPATKKYVDDSPTTYTGYDATKTQVLKNINGTLTWVNE